VGVSHPRPKVRSGSDASSAPTASGSRWSAAP